MKSWLQPSFASRSYHLLWEHSKAQKLFSILILTLIPIILTAQTSRFTEVGATFGISYSYDSPADFAGGITLCDFDGDGMDDIGFGSIAGDRLYIYRNKGGVFNDTLIPGLSGETGNARCLIWADYDNDDDKDLFITNEYGVNKLYRNDGPLGLTDVTMTSGMCCDTMYSYSAAFGDYDRDGWLDIYVVNRNVINTLFSQNRLWHNNGDGTFTDLTVSADAGDTSGLGFSAIFFDFNNDQWPDIFIANDKEYTHNTLLENNGNGTFTDVSDSLTTGFHLDGMGIAVGDYDGNGYLDLYITNTPQSSANFGGNILLRNNGNGSWDEVGDSLGVRVYRVGWGANFMDVDNDGYEDLFVCNGNMGGPGNFGFNSLFYNQGNGTFVEDSTDDITNLDEVSFGSSIGDFNGDGYYDVAVLNANQDACGFYMNMGGGQNNNFIRIHLKGVVSNRDGIGTWIETYAGGRKIVRYTSCGNSYASQQSGTYNIGVGQNSIDSVVFRWPSGIVNVLLAPVAKQFFHIVEDTGNVVIGIQRSVGQMEISLSPNPMQEFSEIKIEGLEIGTRVKADILDVQGKVLKAFSETSMDGKLVLRWDSAPARGIYFWRIRHDEEQFVRKILKF